MVSRGAWRRVNDRGEWTGRRDAGRAHLKAARNAFDVAEEADDCRLATQGAVLAAIAYGDALTVKAAGIRNEADHQRLPATVRHALGNAAPAAKLTRLARFLGRKDVPRHGEAQPRRADAPRGRMQARRGGRAGDALARAGGPPGDSDGGQARGDASVRHLQAAVRGARIGFMPTDQACHDSDHASPDFVAHSRDGAPESEWEPLQRHLERVAERAREFADPFGSAGWGHLTGLWHDLGKYLPGFQRRLRGHPEAVEHAGAGAALAFERMAIPAAFAIAGHHAGLANLKAQGRSSLTPLVDRVERNRAALEEIRALVPDELMRQQIPPLPSYLLDRALTRDDLATRSELWTRFLFSALVDADFLETEAFYQPGRRDASRADHAMASLRSRLDAHLEALGESARGRSGARQVNEVRAEVLSQCIAAAEQPTGAFSLTVPTGGGKTLSSLAFALHHAERHGLRRVIVVIPYTTIIEQTAAVFRAALGNDGAVIEHHSALDEKTARETDAGQEEARRLAAENWDAPVIVTTSVQFFESLFANHPSRCRKLHNIARSVIIIDEAQTVPSQFLLCVLDVLRSLAGMFHCSVVLSTATQPALRAREALPQGLRDVREIITDPTTLARRLKRVSVRWPAAGESPIPYEDLASELTQWEQVLAIVHRRQDARVLAQQLPLDGTFHLSALMCAAHRADALAKVRSQLAAGRTCRLVATQLVEAGVDIDFPRVFRAMGGLDSVAQAAGRCNREGVLRTALGEPMLGHVRVFRAETKPPPGILRQGLEATEAMLTRYGDALDISDPALHDEYFRALYLGVDLDARRVMPERRTLNFATVGDAVRLIEDGFSMPVVVPWGEGEARARQYRASPSRDTQRALQPYVVQVRPYDLRRLEKLGAVEAIGEQVYALCPPYLGLYDARFGLVVDEDAPDPADLIV
ncbi:MAG: CRISPR-associated endonuclease Cas3'' [Gemmatimonadaceae bacterium]